MRIRIFFGELSHPEIVVVVNGNQEMLAVYSIQGRIIRAQGKEESADFRKPGGEGGLFSRRRQLIARAVARHAPARTASYTAGMKFVGLGRTERQHISGLYAFKALRGAL